MIKRMITTAALILSFISLQAASTHISVELKSGHKYDFLMNGKPKFSVNDGELIVKGTDSTSFAVYGVKNFHFKENLQPTNVVSDEIEMRILSVDEQTIKIVNAPVSANITVMNYGGGVCLTGMTDSFGNCTLSLPARKGVYVLSIEHQSFKLIRN